LEFESFDRVVSVEMLEHFKNYQDIFKKIADVLTPDGKFFTHIFTHREYSYPFETEGEDNWMGKYFFTGGQMPSHYLFYEFQRDLVLGRSWAWDGTHYQKTSDAWLENMDTKKELILPILQSVYKQDYQLWFQRWRVFFMACSELFGYQGGSQWGVSHYLFSKRG
jgi:cyclopropane-fatty-acyl-phospholipid synthase